MKHLNYKRLGKIAIALNLGFPLLAWFNDSISMATYLWVAGIHWSVAVGLFFIYRNTLKSN